MSDTTAAVTGSLATVSAAGGIAELAGAVTIFASLGPAGPVVAVVAGSVCAVGSVGAYLWPTTVKKLEKLFAAKTHEKIVEAFKDMKWHNICGALVQCMKFHEVVDRLKELDFKFSKENLKVLLTPVDSDIPLIYLLSSHNFEGRVISTDVSVFLPEEYKVEDHLLLADSVEEKGEESNNYGINFVFKFIKAYRKSHTAQVLESLNITPTIFASSSAIKILSSEHYEEFCKMSDLAFVKETNKEIVNFLLDNLEVEKKLSLLVKVYWDSLLQKNFQLIFRPETFFAFFMRLESVRGVLLESEREGTTHSVSVQKLFQRLFPNVKFPQLKEIPTEVQWFEKNLPQEKPLRREWFMYWNRYSTEYLCELPCNPGSVRELRRRLEEGKDQDNVLDGFLTNSNGRIPLLKFISTQSKTYPRQSMEDVAFIITTVPERGSVRFQQLMRNPQGRNWVRNQLHSWKKTYLTTVLECFGDNLEPWAVLKLDPLSRLETQTAELKGTKLVNLWKLKNNRVSKELVRRIPFSDYENLEFKILGENEIFFEEWYGRRESAWLSKCQEFERAFEERKEKEEKENNSDKKFLDWDSWIVEWLKTLDSNQVLNNPDGVERVLGRIKHLSQASVKKWFQEKNRLQKLKNSALFGSKHLADFLVIFEDIHFWKPQKLTIDEKNECSAVCGNHVLKAAFGPKFPEDIYLRAKKHPEMVMVKLVQSLPIIAKDMKKKSWSKINKDIEEKQYQLSAGSETITLSPQSLIQKSKIPAKVVRGFLQKNPREVVQTLKINDQQHETIRCPMTLKKRLQSEYCVVSALRHAVDILNCCKALKSAKLAHLNIKPSNVGIRVDGHACFIDLESCTHESEYGGKKGTLKYMAPEMQNGKLLNKVNSNDMYACALYAIGVVIVDLTLAIDSTDKSVKNEEKKEFDSSHDSSEESSDSFLEKASKIILEQSCSENQFHDSARKVLAKLRMACLTRTGPERVIAVNAVVEKYGLNTNFAVRLCKHGPLFHNC